jgi:adenosylcobinamide-GDP ribazoletransferase
MPAPSPVRAAAASVTFLTRIPVSRKLVVGPEDVARGAVLFPLVGAGTGALVGLVASTADGRLTPLLAAVVAVAFEALLTGGIHLDALADTADGLGARSRERALGVMQEGAIGAFGATALALDLLAKTAALAALQDGPRPTLTVAAAFAVGRAAALALAWALPYARPEGGTGLVLAGGARAPLLALGLALGVGLAVGALGVRGLALVGAAAAAAAAVALVARRRLGGVTGDVLGAGIETATTLALVAAVATR